MCYVSSSSASDRRPDRDDLIGGVGLANTSNPIMTVWPGAAFCLYFSGALEWQKDAIPAAMQPFCHNA